MARPRKKEIKKINLAEGEILKKAISLELLRRECLNSYQKYVEYIHEGSYKKTKAGKFLCGEVERFLEKKSTAPYEIMIISMPPQHGKSMTITATLPSWYLQKNKKGRVICISYSEEFATFFGRKNREKLQVGELVFGKLLNQDKEAATEFETNEGGSMISRGVLSGVTGRACDLMIIDDPIKNRMEADSEAYRKRVFDEWENSFKTRLSAGAKVILIQTRWHEDDLAGRLISSEKNIKVINLPCEAEENDPLKRKAGDALCPELLKDKAWLRQFKESYSSRNGSRAWSALFQGHPTATEGGIIKRKWWRIYDKSEDELSPLDHLIISVDASFKGEKNSDFVAIQVWGKRRGKFYLVDAIKEQLDFPRTVKMLKKIFKRYPRASHILIEDKANGSAIIQTLRKELPQIVGVNPQGGKVARVNAVCGVIEAGNVYLPLDEPFTADFIDECSIFPNGKHDDQVDCMSQALNRLAFYAEQAPSLKEDSPFGAFNIGKKQTTDTF